MAKIPWLGSTLHKGSPNESFRALSTVAAVTLGICATGATSSPF